MPNRFLAPLKIALVCLCVLAWPASGQADPTWHYVRDGASGGDGSSWSRAWDALPEDLVRGHTYFIADGDYPVHSFNDDEAGSAWITIQKATPASHGDDAGWNDSWGDGVANFAPMAILEGYYVIDGQVGGGPGSWDAGHGIRIRGSSSSDCIRLGATTTPMQRQPNHIVIRHVNAGGEFGSPNYHGLYMWGGAEGWGSQDVTLSHCYFHDTTRSILFAMFGRDWLIEYCYVARNKSTPDVHGSGFADRGTDNVVIRYNRWADIEGTAIIDLKKNEDQDHDNWSIYGNLFYYTAGNPYRMTGLGGNGAIGMTSTESGRSNNILVYNNTFANIVGLNTGVYFPLGSGNVAYNNLWYNCDWAGMTNVDGDYNTYLDTDIRWGSTPGPHDDIGSGDPFVGWSANNFHLADPSRGGLTGLPAPVNVDVEGVTRGADGVWDRGALEYNEGSGGDQLPPTTPTNLRAMATAWNALDLAWNPATDNVGVTYYKVYRDGARIATITRTDYHDEPLAPATQYRYQVRAGDAAFNESPLSAPLDVATDPPPTPPDISIDDASAIEGDTGALNVVFNVTLDNTHTVEVRVDYTTADGTATTAGGDYDAAAGTLTFAPGQTQRAVTVAVNGDLVAEGPETFEVRLSNPVNALLGRDRGTATIQDDDGGFEDSLILHWKLDEQTGAVAHDASGSGIEGELLNGPDWTAGWIDGALGFDGIDDEARAAVSTALDELDAAFSIALWARITRDGSTQYLLDKNGLSRGFYLRTYGDNTLLFKVDDGADDYFVQTDGTTATDGDWHHVAAVVKGREAVEFYIDGAPQISSFSGPLGGVGSIANTARLYLGCNNNHRRHLNGALDDVRVYNRVLSPANVQELYLFGMDRQAPSTPQNLSASARSDSEIDLAWDASSDDDGVAGYRVYRDGTLQADVVGASTTWRDSGLAPATAYAYRVSAYDPSANESARSTTATATTEPPPPSPPSFTSATLAPPAVYETTVLSVQCGGWSDADGDAAGYRYQWRVNGQALAGATGATLTGAEFDKGDRVACAVTAWDGLLEGNAIVTAETVVHNSSPTITSVALAGQPATKSSVLAAVPVGWSDADGDAADYRYQWRVNSQALAGATDSTLAGAFFDKGDAVSCWVTPRDGEAEGARRETATATIHNSSPAFAAATIAPDPAHTASTLSVGCSGWSDADGDAESYRYQWRVNGQALAGATARTLAGGFFDKGDAVTCQVTAWDGEAEGNRLETAPRQIRNSPPAFAGATVWSNAAVTQPSATASQGSALWVECAGWSDADGDAEDYRYQWLKSGAALAGATGRVLEGRQVAAGDVISCRITAWDGAAEGRVVETAPLTVEPLEGGALYDCLVDRLYLELLGRAPLPAERQDARDALCTGAQSVEGLTLALLDSPEFLDRTGFIIRCYLTLFNDGLADDYGNPRYRLPDPGGLAWWLRKMAESPTPREAQIEVVRQFLAGPEWRWRNGVPTPEEFVRFLIRRTLGREPRGDELPRLTGELASGAATTGSLLLDFLRLPVAATRYRPQTIVAAGELLLLWRPLNNVRFGERMAALDTGELTPEQLLWTTLYGAPDFGARLERLGCGLPLSKTATASFAAASSYADEDAGEARIAVRLSAVPLAPVTLNYTVRAGNARNGEDFRLADGTLTFDVGQVSQDVVVELLDDAAVEPSERTTLILSNPSPSLVLWPYDSHVLSILSNEPAPPLLTRVRPSSGWQLYP